MVTRVQQDGKARTVPVVSGLPLLGSALALRRNQLRAYEQARARHGDVVRFVAGPPGWRQDVYGVFSPTGAQHVLVDAAGGYRKETPVYLELAAMLGDGLLTSQDERWRRQRRFVAPLFTRRRVEDYAGAMAEEAERVVDRWRPAADAGATIDVYEEAARYTVRVVSRILFGADVEAAIPAVRAALPLLGEQILRRGLSPRPLPRSWPTPAMRRAERARTDTYGVVDSLIAARRAGGQDGNGNDLLGRLLAARDPERGDALTDDEIRDQVLIFLLAGHETTATTVACALHLLGGHPDVARRVRAEADQVVGGAAWTAQDVAALDYTAAVVKETLRLYPPAYVVPRLSTTDDVVDGYAIPAGSITLVGTWALHRHPAHWSQPERFDPDRFVPEASDARHRYAWIPFGAGARACIGAQFAMMEAVIVLASLVQTFDVVSAPGPVSLSPLIALRPDRVPCVLRPRS